MENGVKGSFTVVAIFLPSVAFPMIFLLMQYSKESKLKF